MKRLITNWLNRLSIARKINFIFIPPTIALIVFSSLSLLNADARISEAKSVKEIVSVALLLDKIAHNHAVERGLTAGFVASGGTRGADKLAKQRQKAEAARSEFVTYYNSNNFSRLPDNVQSMLNKLNTQLSEVPALQKQVDKLDPAAKPFAVYSAINKLAIDSIAYLNTNVSNPRISKQLNTLIGLLWLKERSGQERGALNGVFVKGTSTLKKFGDINFYIQDQQSKSDAIKQNVTTQEFDQIINAIEDENHADVLVMRNAFLNAVFNQQPITVDASTWFEKSTRRIGNIKKLAGSTAANIVSISNNLLSSARFQFWSNVLITTLILAIIVVLSLMISNMLRTNIGSIINGLKTVKETNNFSTQLTVNTKDELADAAKQFNDLMTQLKETIASVNQVVDAVARGDFGLRVEKQLVGDLAMLKDGVNSSATKVSDTMNALETVMDALKNGDFSARMSSDVEGEFKQKVDRSMASMETSIREFSSVMKKVSQGDFSVRLTSDMPGLLNELKVDVNSSINNLVSAFTDIGEAAQQQQKGNFAWTIRNQYQGQIGELTATINNSMSAISAAIQEIIRIFTDLKEGRYEKRIATPMNGDLDTMKTNLNDTLEALDSAIAEIVDVAKNQAAGNLSQRINGNYRGQLNTLKTALNESGSVLKTTFSEIANVMQAMQDGEFSNRIELDMNGEFDKIKLTVNRTLQLLEKTIDEISDVTRAQKDGDLSARMSDHYKGSLKTISKAINQSMINLSGTVKEIQQSAGGVKTMANDQLAAIEDMSSRTEQQASSLEEIASTMEEMSSLLENTEIDSDNVAKDLVKTDQAANSVMQTVEETVTSMDAMKKSSLDIAEITGMIDEIAFQTNLLALNASVEAARAGEQGRGFAVVATEVQTLAQRSSDAARQIKGLIDDNGSRVDGSFELARKSQESLQGIVSTLSTIRDNAENISNASREQATGVREINNAISYLDTMTQQNASMVGEIKVSTSKLTGESNNVDSKLQFFST